MKKGDCPFFGRDKLCGIYKTLGPSVLSHTCQTYPRSKTQLGGYIQHSLSFSCPEVVRLVLFQPDSMKYEESTVVENVKITEKRVIDQSKMVTQEHQVIQLFCSHLIMADAPFIENNL
ncbi:MAG: flagellin lysine-N-methylase [Candidatus Phlomobacter fragariae]